jgi:hypothetical protein
MLSRRRTNILAGTLLLVGTAIAAHFIFRAVPDPVDDKNRTVLIWRTR